MISGFSNASLSSINEHMIFKEPLVLLGIAALFAGLARLYYTRKTAINSDASREVAEGRREREKPDLQVTKAHAQADAETIFGLPGGYPPCLFLDVYLANAGGSPVTVDRLLGKLEGGGGDIRLGPQGSLRISGKKKLGAPRRIATKDLPSGVEPYHIEEVVAVDLKGNRVAASVEGREEARAVSGAKKLRSDVAGDPDGHSHVEAELFEEDDPKGGRRFVVAWREHSHSSVYSHLKRRAKRREAEDLLDDVLEEAGRRLDADENVAEIRRSLDLAS